MATAESMLPSEKKALFLKYISLMHDGGKLVLLDLCEKLSSPDLVNELINKRQHVKHLKKTRKIYQDQYDLMYPPSGQPDTSKFDVSLLSTLLREVCGVQYPKKQPPDNTDDTVEANVYRLTKMRNVCSHPSKTEMTEQEFNSKWQELTKVLLSLGSGNSDLQTFIDKLKQASIDPGREKELLDQIAVWKTELDDLKDGMRELKTDLSDIKDTVQSHGDGIQKQEDEIGKLNQRVTAIEIPSKPMANKVSEDVMKEVQQHLISKYEEDNMYWKSPVADEQATFCTHLLKRCVCCLGRNLEVQQHLISKYEEDNMYWKSPVADEQAFLSEMYVQPSVKCIREINEHGTFVEVNKQNPQPSKLIYKDIFETKTGLCKNIYVTGEAGAGKSTFCNQLVCNWCSVKNKSDNNLSSEDQNLLSSFSLLFHINLRDCETVYRVEDMIKEQLLSNVPGDFNISDILRNKRCLIVLDGLDEWSCPDNAKKCPKINKHIPGRNTENKNCVFITTSRNWKYDIIALENKDRDKHLELIGINRDESVELAKKMLDHLDIEKKSIKKADTFFSEMEEKKLNEFLSVPVLLIQLITLWFFGKDFGNSQLQLYCSMLDLLFERSEKNLPEEISKCSSTTVATPKQLPECFSRKLYCKKYAGLLHCLAELAYKALFNKQKEEALVFKRETLDILGISPPDITLCLHCGILSQCKDYDKRYGKYKKFSFLHKKVQEYFAALYLVTNDNVEDNLKEVKQFCNSVETMLEMNQVWLFVAGMDPEMTRRLFECLGDVVSGDELVKTYRQTLDDRYNSDSVSLIGGIQYCVSDCVSEGINNGQHYENLCLEDFYIDYNNVRDVERLVFCFDMSKVKSVYIGTEFITAAKVAAITGQFLQCRSLQRLYLYDLSSRIPESTVAALVKNNCDSLTSLHLSTEIKDTDKLVTDICSSISKSLMALGLGGVELTHERREQILHSLSKSPAIRQLELIGLDCTDHGDKCRARIDLSALSQLQKLTLQFFMHVDILQSLPHSVEKVKLHSMYVDNLPSLPHSVEKVKLHSMYVDNLPSLPHSVEKVKLHSMYVDNLPSLPHSVEEVYLSYVTLAVTSLRDFALGLSKTRRAVNVRLKWVTFTETREECGDLEGFLHSCPGLVVTECYYIDDTDSGWPNTWRIDFHTNSQ